jgi:hypothetical protein
MKNIILLSLTMFVYFKGYAQIDLKKTAKNRVPEKSFVATKCSQQEALAQVGGPEVVLDPKLTFQLCIKTGNGFSDKVDPKFANHLVGYIKVYNHQGMKYQVGVYYFWKGNQINTTLQTIKPNSSIVLSFDMTAIKGKEGENSSVEVRSQNTMLKPAVISPNANLPGSVYVAGFDTQENTEKGFNFYTPKYWKNGKIATFSETNSRLYAIVVNGNDIYLAGTKELESGGDHATYWKNGTANSLPASNIYNSKVASMISDGSDMYMVGSADNVGVYWKNGDSTKLSNSVSANSIAVDGGNVYIAGGGILGVPKLWKNGVEIPFSDVQNQRLNSIAIYDNNVYLAGFQYIGGNYSIARIWKNGVPTDLTNSNGRASANSIAVYKGDVYVAGYDNNGNGGNTVAKYWKNGVPVSLTNGNREASANSILIVGGDVYIAGNDGGTAKYWKNGVVTILGTGTATSIFVK